MDPEAKEKSYVPKWKASGERKRRPSVEIFPGENPNDEIFKHMRKYMDKKDGKIDNKEGEKTNLPTWWEAPKEEDWLHAVPKY